MPVWHTGYWSGSKLAYIPGLEGWVRTPHGKKLRLKRRAANRVAKQARKVNRRNRRK